MVFAEVVGTLSFLKPQADDDFVDRLHYYYTSTFLLVAAVLMSLKMFGGRPIECWVPAEYRGGWEDYTEMFCWARNTYWVPFDEEIPEDISSREERTVSYYQWTPFFFVICAFMFYTPCLVWRLIYDKSGIRIKDIMAFATDQTNIEPTSRQANIQALTAHLSTLFRQRRRLERCNRKHYMYLANFRYNNAYLTSAYIFIKFLYLVNLIGQIFIVLWMWYCLLTLISVCSWFSWFCSSVSKEARKRFVLRRLELADVEFRKSEHDLELDEFARHYVRLDGIFVLKLLTIHAGTVMCTEIVNKMWRDFLLLRERNIKLKRTETPPVLLFEVPTETEHKRSVVVPLVASARETDFPVDSIRVPELVRSDHYRPVAL